MEQRIVNTLKTVHLIVMNRFNRGGV